MTAATPEVLPADVLAGVVVDVGGIAVGLGAEDARRADAVASLFRHARIVTVAPTVALRFRAVAGEVPDRPPDQALDHLDLWWTGPGRLVARSGPGLSADFAPDVIVVGGDAPALAREFRFLALVGLTHVLARRGRLLFHGAALVVDNAALLVVGASGSGKSTLTFAAHRLGWPVLADDAVLLEHRGSQVVAQGVPRPIAVAADVLAGAVAGGRLVPEDVRQRVEMPPGTLSSGEHPVVAVAVVTGTGTPVGGPSITPLAGPDALRRLLGASVALMDADARPALFEICGALARLPVWALHRGDDPAAAIDDASRRLEDLRHLLAQPGEIR